MPAPAAVPLQQKDDDVCFTAESTVEREDGARVALADLEVGDRVLTLKDGRAGFSDVVAVPHQRRAGDAGAEARAMRFVAITSASGRSLEATASHLIAAADAEGGDCGALGAGRFAAAARLVQASEVARGMCVAVREPRGGVSIAAVEDVREVERRTRALSVVTMDGGLPFVDGVAASPFALNHAVPNAFYNLHRLLYAAGARSVLGSAVVRSATDAVGAVAVRVHRAFAS